MTLNIRCPHCGSVRSVNPRVLGREIQCPDCDRGFRADESTRVDPEPAATRNDASSRNRSNKKDDSLGVAEPVREPGPGSSRRSDSGGRSGLTDSERMATATAATAEPEPDPVGFEIKELPKDDMDMTPMVDVTFLLLIFFMITASFSSEKVFEKPPPMLETPSTRPPDTPPELFDSVRIQIDEFNAYTILFPTGDEREASSKQDLLIALGDARNELATGKDDENLKLLVEAHEECIHASIVAALDAGREKGFNSFTVSVVEEFE